MAVSADPEQRSGLRKVKGFGAASRAFFCAMVAELMTFDRIFPNNPKQKVILSEK